VMEKCIGCSSFHPGRGKTALLFIDKGIKEATGMCKWFCAYPSTSFLLDSANLNLVLARVS
jgi:hypothetical protein